MTCLNRPASTPVARSCPRYCWLQIAATAKDSGATITSLSNVTEEGVMVVRNEACDQLLSSRTDAKKAGSRLAEVSHRLVVTMPKPRDTRARPSHIPASVARARAADAADEDTPMDADEAATAAAAASSHSGSAAAASSGTEGIRKLEVDLEREQGGVGVYSTDMSKHYLLDEEDWKRDVMPEIMDGRNVVDYVDPEILTRLEALEAEEAALEARYSREAAAASAVEAAKTPLERAEAIAEARLAKAVRGQRSIRSMQSRLRQATNSAVMPKTIRGRAMTRPGLAAHLETLGMDASGAAAVAKAAPVRRQGKRGRSTDRRPEGEGADGSDVEMDEGVERAKRRRSKSVMKGVAAPQEGEGFRDLEMKSRAIKSSRQAQKKMQSEGRKGEGDRFIGTKMPKHLFSGKRGIGTTDWR